MIFFSWVSDQCLATIYIKYPVMKLILMGRIKFNKTVLDEVIFFNSVSHQQTTLMKKYFSLKEVESNIK